MDWRQARHWFMPPVHPLLSSVLGTAVTAAGLRRATTAVHMQARLAAANQGLLLGNSCSAMQQEAVLLPAAAALMMAAAAVDSCSTISAQEAVPQIVLADSVFQQLVWAQSEAAALELSITVQVKDGTLSISSAGSSPVSVLSTRVVKHAVADSIAVAVADGGRAPAFLTSLMHAAQQHYNQLPGPIAKAQAASAPRSASAAAIEPAVAALCQLEASFLLPFFTSCSTSGAPDAAHAQVPAALASCVLNPRGFGGNGALDVVDPDAAEDAVADASAAARTSTFWVTSSTSGIGMQLTGMAFRPLAAAVNPAPAAAGMQAAIQGVGPLPVAPALLAAPSTGAGAAAAAAVVLAGGTTQVRGMVFRPLAQQLPEAAVEQQQQLGVASPANPEDSYTFSTEWVAVAVAGPGDYDGAYSSNGALQLAAAPHSSSVAYTAAAMSVLQVSHRQQAATQALQLHTSGALAPAAAPGSADYTAAAPTALWAVLRAARVEQTGLDLSALDSASPQLERSLVALSITPAAVAGAGTSSTTAAGESRFLYGCCVSGGVLFEARLVRQPLPMGLQVPPTAAGVLQVLPAAARQGTYIVTGGTGAVAAVLGQWLISQLKVQHVHFASRSGTFPAGISQLLQSSSSGEECTLVTASKADVSTAEEAACVATCMQQGLPILGLMHAAGVLADGLLQSQSLGSIRHAAAPKVAAFQQLQRHLGHQPISHQVLFSSVASLLGSPGQTNYAAANAWLDAAAPAAQASGMPCVSVQFGAWAGAGMAGRDAQTAARAARLGMALLTREQALSALALVVRSVQQEAAAVPAVLAAVPITWEPFLRHLPQPVSSFFSNFVATGSDAAAAAPPEATALQLQQTAAAAATAASVDAAATEQQVSEAVGDAVSSILGAEVGPYEPLMAAGLDSLGAVELRNMLQESLAVSLPNTVSTRLQRAQACIDVYFLFFVRSALISIDMKCSS
jgi:hypothetical protein